MEKVGTVHSKNAMFLRTVFATAEDEENSIEYEVAQTASGQPLVTNNNTGKTFSLSFDELVKIAIENGLNDE